METFAIEMVAVETAAMEAVALETVPVEIVGLERIAVETVAIERVGCCGGWFPAVLPPSRCVTGKRISPRRGRG